MFKTELRYTPFLSKVDRGHFRGMCVTGSGQNGHSVLAIEIQALATTDHIQVNYASLPPKIPLYHHLKHTSCV